MNLFKRLFANLNLLADNAGDFASSFAEGNALLRKQLGLDDKPVEQQSLLSLDVQEQPNDKRRKVSAS